MTLTVLFRAVLYEMATGQLPFRGDTSGVIFKAILGGTPTSAVRLNPDLPVELERIINKCLQKDRKLRYQHASDVRTDLQRLKRGTESARFVAISASPDQMLKRRKFWIHLYRRYWAGGGRCLVLALWQGGPNWFYRRLRRPMPQRPQFPSSSPSAGTPRFWISGWRK